MREINGPLQKNIAGFSRSRHAYSLYAMMKPALRALRIACLLAGITALAPPLRADDGPKTPLQMDMSGMGRDVRSLKKLAIDPAQKEAALAAVKDLEDRAAKAKTYEPSKTKDIPASQKDQFLADYHKQLDVLSADIRKLRDAIQAGDTARAQALIDKLNSDKRDGHRKFNAQKR